MNTGRRQITQFVDQLHPDVRRNVEMITAQGIGTPRLFHVSTNGNIRTVVPSVSKRTAFDEDRTVPRISTAPTLGGALLGYQALEMDYEQPHVKKEFQGGWYLYEFQFDFALRPNKKLVYDVEMTDEVWLVPYTPQHWSIQGKKAGRFFIESVNVTRKRDLSKGKNPPSALFIPQRGDGVDAIKIREIGP